MQKSDVILRVIVCFLFRKLRFLSSKPAENSSSCSVTESSGAYSLLFLFYCIVTVVFPDLIDMKYPNRSSSSKKKHANKIEIDFNSLIAQGLQRDRDKEAKKQEKKERRRRAQKAAGGPKDLL